MIQLIDCLELKDKLPLKYFELCELIIKYKELEEYLINHMNRGNFDGAIFFRAESIINQLIIEHLSILKPFFTTDELNTAQKEIKDLLKGIVDLSGKEKGRLYDDIRVALDGNNENLLKLDALLKLQRYSNFATRVYQLLINTYDSLISGFDSKYANNAQDILSIYPVHEKILKPKEGKGELIEIPKGAIELTT